MRKKGAINSITEDAKSIYSDYLEFLQMPVITESGRAPLFEAVDTVTVSLIARNEKDAEGLGKLLFWTVPESYLFDTLAQRLPKYGTGGHWDELDELRKRYQNAESLSNWSDIPDIYLQIASRTGTVPSLPQGAEFGPHGGFDGCTIRGSYELLLPGKLMKAVCRIAGLKDPTDDHTLTSAEASFAIFYRKMRALVRSITVADADHHYIPENSLENRTLQLHSKLLRSALFEFHDVAITSTGSVYVDGVEESCSELQKALLAIAYLSRGANVIRINRDEFVELTGNAKWNANKTFSTVMGRIQKKHSYFDWIRNRGPKYLSGLIFTRVDLTSSQLESEIKRLARHWKTVGGLGNGGKSSR